VLPIALAALVGGCAGEGESTTTVASVPTRVTSVPTTTITPDQGVVFSPEFIQGAIPGELLVILVGNTDPGAATLTVTAEATDASVSVDPSAIGGGEVAEVTVVPSSTDIETQMSIHIEADDGQTHSWTVDVLPWEDELEGQARDILLLFTTWLAEHRPDLGVTPKSELEGTFVAPELLVVSHYAFYSDEWELGLSWHIMLPPDDFSELYLRPRSELAPTMAFRIDSWQTALQSGSADIIEVPPPAEVVR